MPDRPLTVLLSAGEASGDRHAARLVRELRALHPSIRVDALGGPEVAAAGARVIYPLADHAVMGFRRVFAALGRFLKLLSSVDEYLETVRPDVVVPVDYPGFNLNLALLARRRGIPVCYYICPQFWAWASWRSRRLARATDEGLVIFPFEAPYFASAGVRTTFVGHPLADILAPGDGAETSTANKTTQTRETAREPKIALLAGSRGHEIERHLEWMAGCGVALREQCDPRPRFVTTHPDSATRSSLRERFAAAGLEVTACDDTAACLQGARLAVVCSGTATLECALHQVPSLVLYRVGRVGAALSKLLVDVPFIAQPNLVLGEEVFPEFLAWRDPGGAMARAGAALYHEGLPRERCLEHLAEIRRRIGRPGTARRAAERVLARAEGRR